ncbi:MAG: putative ABC transport system ATP-binding protein [Planctomycetota bacterium]|jgi:putative ABC transport system ATP-binding protein
MNASSGPPLVRARALLKDYPTAAGPLRVLAGVDLDLAGGETLAITGESGSGKSTLLALLAGLDTATSGSLEVAGRNLASAREADLADFRASTVGIVFQHFHLMRSLTAVENVALPLELRDGGDPGSRAAEALAMVGLQKRHDHFPAQLSGGECQRVALARAIVTEPRLLLADEPTGNLDERTGMAVADLLFDLVERRGTALILVTHSESLAARCGRRLHLHDGQLAPAA